jgi:DNA polymerase III subunit delta'
MSRSQAREAAPEPTAPPPRANPDLLGHEAAEAELRPLFDSGRMPHALLLSGPRGIGKATLAFRLARFVLAQGGRDGGGPSLFVEDGGGGGGAGSSGSSGLAIPPESGTFRRVASGGHADLLTIERAYDPRRRRLRGEIVVGDTREIGTFLRLTPAEGGWRVVVVDGADEMNRNAANALLKILEEPPRRALLLLIAHSPGKLLPTIRSRCRRLALSPLPTETVRQLLVRYRPDLAAADAEAIAALAGGSIGTGLDLADAGGLDLYRSLLGLLTRPRVAELHAFADRLARADAEDSYRLVQELIGEVLARLARRAAGHEAHEGVEMAELEGLVERAPARVWAGLRDQIGENFNRADGLNLDRKQALLGAFFAIEHAAG